ncbi:unnamed protein product, partial [Polarella glacialis]
VPSYAFLAVYMQVRVVSDVEVLRQLCKRCAPGARLKVEWVSEMKLLAGLTCRVKQLRDEICGIQLESPDGNQTDRPTRGQMCWVFHAPVTKEPAGPSHAAHRDKASSLSGMRRR